MHFKAIKNKLSWLYEGGVWYIFKLFFTPLTTNPNKQITIGVTTFMDRYHNCLRPLLKKMAILFPETQIIIIANGHVKKNEQLNYLKDIKSFCTKFPNVKLVSFKDPKGLSFLWNKIIKSSTNPRILILNDDVRIRFSFANWLNNELLSEREIFTINRSWSHFLISKDIVNKVGLFDEGLLEIGGEDDDYSARLALNKIDLGNINTNTISAKLKLKNKRLVVNSYGKNMNEEVNGYSTYNSHYLKEKWQISNDYFEGAIEVPSRMMRYWKLKSKKPN